MNRNWIFLFLLFNSAFVFAQQLDPYYAPPKPFPENYYPKKIDSADYFNPKFNIPIVSAGTGVLTFLGDIDNKSFLKPSLSFLSYHLSVSEQVSRSLSLSGRAMFGTLGATEMGTRYLNFKSSIRVGGLNIIYNFDKFLPAKRRIDPFVLTGFEYMEFLSKTDLYDGSGNKYHYWKNGSIMNLDENNPNAANAISLSRDYSYETDIRKMNQELFGKYKERSFAIPVGAGVTFHPAPRIHVQLGATMHFTFTDYIDGITPANKGEGYGKAGKDKFMEGYFTISFELFKATKPAYESTLSKEELLALAEEDTDKDGVIDFNDSCQGTPEGIAVDAKGCPLNSDDDRFPDYLDKEPNSFAGAIVDEEGIAMSDSTIAQKWRVWSDTANIYALYTDTIINPVAAFIGSGNWKKGESKATPVTYRRELVVLIGNYKGGVPPDEMNKLLSIPDVRSLMQADSSASYVVGSYGALSEAEKRMDELKKSGFPKANVMVLNRDGALSSPTATNLADVKSNKDFKSNNTANPFGVVYRIQLGAYSKSLSSSIFKNVNGIIQMRTEENLYKYMSGSNSTLQDAMKQRNELLKKGYKGAFVVAYKNGKRVSLSSVSGGIVTTKDEDLQESKQVNKTIDKNLISFRVQVGSYATVPPSDILEKYRQLPNLIRKKNTSNNDYQYYSGKFSDYNEAKKFCDDLIEKQGIKSAFVVAFFKDEIISVQEALELIR